VAFGIFESIGRLRGWSEVNGLLDGLVYGGAVGLGFATGEAFLREQALGNLFTLRQPSEFSILWKTLLVGLAYGVFGAIMGAGFGASVEAASPLRRAIYPLAGFLGALLVHVGYLQLARGGALGSAGQLRAIIALTVPLVFVLALLVAARSYEASTLRAQLQPETALGLARLDEVAVVRSPARRRRLYLERFLKGDFDSWVALRTLHNRLVQLALVKARAEREDDASRRARVQREVEQLRVAVAAARQAVAERTGGASATEARME
jgi:hypothetical protein